MIDALAASAPNAAATAVPLAAAAVTASVTAVVGVAAWLQKLRADRRTQWWARVAWAIDKSVATDRMTRSVGLKTLTLLGRSKLADSDDRELLREVARQVIEEWRATP